LREGGRYSFLGLPFPILEIPNQPVHSPPPPLPSAKAFVRACPSSTPAPWIMSSKSTSADAMNAQKGNTETPTPSREATAEQEGEAQTKGGFRPLQPNTRALPRRRGRCREGGSYYKSPKAPEGRFCSRPSGPLSQNETQGKRKEKGEVKGKGGGGDLTSICLYT
jgi:hypothetical protein